MRILYGKKKAVPDFCPQCGSGIYLQLKSKQRKLGLGQRALGFGDCLAMYLNMWRPVLATYRGASWAPAWWGECGNCTLNEAMLAPSIFGNLVGREEWRGGTLLVPFK